MWGPMKRDPFDLFLGATCLVLAAIPPHMFVDIIGAVCGTFWVLKWIVGED